jgi:hypothetical protein
VDGGQRVDRDDAQTLARLHCPDGVDLHPPALET